MSDPRSAEDPLAQLDHDERAALADLASATADLDDDERAAVANIAAAAGDGGVGRRTVLQALGVLGIGTLLGVGATKGVDEVAADPDPDDSAGDVGAPGDRVDVFAEGVDLGTGHSIFLGDNDEGDLEYDSQSGAVVLSGTGLVVPTISFTGDTLNLPGVSSSPSASTRDMWYRTDLD